MFPLVNEPEMRDVAEKLQGELVATFRRVGAIELDEKQTIGKRYARMDEAGCPYCVTIDGETITNQTATVRDRATGVVGYLERAGIG